SLAKAQFEKSRVLYERSLGADAESDPVAADLAQLLLEQHENESPTRWTVLKPVEAKSKLGATLSILPDHSILASGANPVPDRYRVVSTVGTDINVAAIRLEALTHPSLPRNGPGRNSAGRFVQDSWIVTARLPNRKDPITLEFDKALADQQLTYAPTTNGALN